MPVYGLGDVWLLSQFIKYLEENKLIEFEILGDTESCFQNRFKIQKYVFLAKRFGLELPFEHDIYLYGPYSQSLISECYVLANNRKELYDAVDAVLPESFQSQNFLNLIQDKNTDWLEIATTLMNKNHITNREDLVENVENTKNGFTREFISGVLDDLSNTNLVTHVH